MYNWEHTQKKKTPEMHTIEVIKHHKKWNIFSTRTKVLLLCLPKKEQRSFRFVRT